MKKQILALFISFIMIFSALPVFITPVEAGTGGTYTLTVGQTQTLRFNAPTGHNIGGIIGARWTSTHPFDVVIVSPGVTSCLIRADRAFTGRAIVHVAYEYTYLSGNSMRIASGFADFTIFVNPINPSSITISQSSRNMNIGDSFTLSATLTPSNATTTLTWSSSNNNVATVTSSGVVRAVNPGTADITVRTSNNLAATCRVTVVEQPFTLRGVFPSNNSDGVLMNTHVSAEFSLPLYQGTQFNNISLRNTDIGTNISGTTAIRGNTLTFTPAQNLSPNTNYQFTIPVGAVRNQWNTSFATEVTTRFKTGVFDIVSSVPRNHAERVPVNQVIQINYSGNIQAGSAYDEIKLYRGTSVVDSNIEISNNRLIITPNINLEHNTAYRVVIPANALANTLGQPLVRGDTVAFTTIPRTETPVASPSGGGVVTGQRVSLSSATAGARIYYTLDGSEPTTESELFTSAIVIFSPITIKAIAVADGYDNSGITTTDYYIDDNAVTESIVWNQNMALTPNVTGHPYASVHTIYGDLTIGDNVRIFSQGISQGVINVKGTLTLGRNAAVIVRNGFYPSAPVNSITSSTTVENMIARATYEGNGYALFPGVYGRGGNGGSGGRGGNAISTSTPAFSPRVGGGGGGGGAGGYGGGSGGSGGAAGTGAVANGVPGGSGWDNGGPPGNRGISSNSGWGGQGGGHFSPIPTIFNIMDGGAGDTYYDGGGAGGGGGGAGGYGGGVLVITAEEIIFDQANPPLLIVSGQRSGNGGAGGTTRTSNGSLVNTASSGMAGTNGTGGVLVINASNAASLPTSLYNLGSFNYTVGQNTHGIITGNPARTFINMNTFAEPLEVTAFAITNDPNGDTVNVAFNTRILEGVDYSDIEFINATDDLTVDGTLEINNTILRFLPNNSLPVDKIYQLYIPENGLRNMANEPSEEIKLSFSPPLAPQNLTATGRTSQAALSWSPPLSNGNNTITGYQVSIDNGETWVAAHGMSNHIFTLENITQDTEFTFNVRAQNRLGAGEEASVTLIIGLPVYCEECELDKIDCICCTICRKLECICPPPILCDECGEEKDISPCCGWCVDCDNEYGYIQCPECSGCSWCFDFCNMCGECLDCCECPHICYLCGEEKEIVCPLCEWCVDCNELFGYVHCPSCDWCDFCNDLAGYVHCPDCGWCDWCSWCSICGECKNCCDCCEECRQIDCVCCDICEKYPCECIPLPVVTSVTVSPSSLTMEPGETYMFNAIVDGTNNPPQDVTWDIAGNSHIETMITSSGALSVHLNETATTLAVTAHSTLAGYTSISGAAIVMITHNVDINEINFPDEIFRTWLLNHPFGQNGILTTAEIAALNEINVAGLGITDLTGIEHFTALHTLYCNDNELIALDVSKNTGLMKLFVNNNYMADESAITGIENIIAFTAWDTDDFLFFPQHPKPGITTTSLPGGVFDIFYTHTLAVAGNVFFWSVEDGDLPDGLTLSEIGVISGMPEKAGTFTFTVKAPNPAGSDTRVFSITIGKANQNTPLGIGSTHETSPGANDGTITGVTTGMEYKLSTDTTYTAISGTTVTGLAPGMYYVRYAETANLNAGADTNVTVYAFTALTHAINVIGGTASPPTAAAGDTVVLTANPPEGYTFNNWEVVSPLGLIITNNTFIMPDEPVFAEAVFKQISDNAHDIIIINGGENASASPNPADEGDEVSLYAGTRAGHTFSHWTGETFTASSPGALDMVQIFNMDLYIEKADCPTSATFIMPNEPVEVTAHWELSLWRVAFDLAGGVYAGNQELIEQFIPHGSDATPLSQNPTRDGHMFMGWSQPLTDLMNIIEERIFTAQWEELSDGEFTVQWPGNSVKFMKLSVDVEDNYEGANFTGATVTIEVTGALPNDLLEIKIPVSFTVYVGSGDEDITVDAVIRMRTNNLGKGSNSLVVKLEDILAGTAATGSDGFNGIINTPTVNLVEGFVLGSVTQSGRVTSADATALARWLIADPADRSALEESLNFCKYAADMDATNKVVLQDLTTLQRWLVGHNVSALQ